MVTLADVAGAAGVSVATVSKALTGQVGRIPPATVAHVQQVARQIGYRPHALAQAVRRGRSNCIGMLQNVVQQVDRFDQFWPRLQLGVERGLRQRHLDLLILGGASLSEACTRLDQARHGRQVDGLLLTALPGVGALPPPTGPVVQIAGRPFPGMPAVVLDPRPGLTAAVQHLAGRGFQRVLVIELGDGQHTLMPERGDHLAGLGLPCTRRTIPKAWTGVPMPTQAVSATLPLVAPLLADLPDRTAVLAANDLVALACLRLLRPRVGQAVAVVGFDDTQAEYGDPPLATISHELVEMGLAAAGLIADLVEGRPAADLVIPSRFIPRETA